MALTIKDREKTRIKADNILSDLKIAAGDHQGGAYRRPHLEGADHDYIKELYQKRQNPKNPLDGDELPGGDMQLKLPLAKKSNPLTIAGLLLPGETPAGGRGGLGSMNKDQLERWIKENGISGTAADKIRKKWEGLSPGLPDLTQLTPDAQKALMIRGLETFKKDGGDALGKFLQDFQQPDPKRPYQPSGSLRG